MVTGSVQKPVDPAKVDPIVAETRGWKGLENKGGAADKPKRTSWKDLFLPKDRRTTGSIKNEAASKIVKPQVVELQTPNPVENSPSYDSEIVSVGEPSKKSLWKRFVAAGKRGGQAHGIKPTNDY